ncbi:hypothetical protein [Amycolatopsis sp. NPDC052450]|uniref:hypothetical protein n=1 Tax=Amycolatopsis sp. NPDC052450 TaxID=3363937 RepID=UPI0037C51AB9
MTYWVYRLSTFDLGTNFGYSLGCVVETIVLVGLGLEDGGRVDVVTADEVDLPVVAGEAPRCSAQLAVSTARTTTRNAITARFMLRSRSPTALCYVLARIQRTERDAEQPIPNRVLGFVSALFPAPQNALKGGGKLTNSGSLAKEPAVSVPFG